MNTTSWCQWVCAVGISASALACGDSSADDESRAKESISSAPLSGKLAGKAFAAVSATASLQYGDEEGTERRIEIYDAEVTCDEKWSHTGPALILTAPWEDGLNESLLSLGQAVTFYEPPANNLATTTGQLEIVSAPSADGALGKIRLRASYDDDNEAEGEIEVQICPKTSF